MIYFSVDRLQVESVCGPCAHLGSSASRPPQTSLSSLLSLKTIFPAPLALEQAQYVILVTHRIAQSRSSGRFNYWWTGRAV
jgi:hypothetical protein